MQVRIVAQRTREQLDAIAPAAIILAQIQQAYPAVLRVRTAAGVHVDKADRLILVIDNRDSSVIVRMVCDGCGIIGLGDKAAQAAVRGAPRVGIAGDVIVPVLGGVYVLMAQRNLVSRARRQLRRQMGVIVYIISGEAAVVIKQVCNAGV